MEVTTGSENLNTGLDNYPDLEVDEMTASPWKGSRTLRGQRNFFINMFKDLSEVAHNVFDQLNTERGREFRNNVKAFAKGAVDSVDGLLDNL